MKHKSQFCFFIAIFSLILAACQSSVSTPPIRQTPEAKREVPTPPADASVLTGRALQGDGTPFVETPMRLAQIYRQGDQGAFVIDTASSPAAMTDNEGFFTFVNVPPAEYLIVIGWLEASDYIIFQNKSGEPYTYQLESGKVRDLGEIKIERNP